MKTGTRARMVAGAVDLIRQRGLNGTSVREVVRHTDTPRGSISYHFPDGKQQLVEEALELVRQQVSVPFDALLQECGAVEGLKRFVSQWRQVLVSTRCRAGCPVLSVSVEHYIGDDGNPNVEVQDRLLKLANGIFRGWQDSLEASLLAAGVSEPRARRLAILVVAAVEGAVALCRADRHVTLLDDVAVELEMLLADAIAIADAQKNEKNR